MTALFLLIVPLGQVGLAAIACGVAYVISLSPSRRPLRRLLLRGILFGSAGAIAGVVSAFAAVVVLSLAARGAPSGTWDRAGAWIEVLPFVLIGGGYLGGLLLGASFAARPGAPPPTAL